MSAHSLPRAWTVSAIVCAFKIYCNISAVSKEFIWKWICNGYEFLLKVQLSNINALMIFFSERNPIDMQQWFLQVSVPQYLTFTFSQIQKHFQGSQVLTHLGLLSTIFVNACNSSGQRTEALSAQPSASPAAQVSQVETLFSPHPRPRQPHQPQLRRL